MSEGDSRRELGRQFDESYRQELLAKIAHGFYPLGPTEAASYAERIKVCSARELLGINVEIMFAANMETRHGLK